MSRFACALVVACFACSPETQPAEDGDFFVTQPFASPVAPVVVAPETPARAVTEPEAAEATPSDAAQASSAEPTTPPENLARRVWLAQEGVWRTGQRLRAAYGEPAVGWLRVARAAAGAQVTTGTVTQLADGTARYAPGGATLRLIAKDGWSGELRVDALVGDVAHAGFPRANERVDATWLFSGGRRSRCVLEQGVSRFEGSFPDEAGRRIEVELVSRRTLQVSSGENFTGGFSTVGLGEGSDSGRVSYPGERVIAFATRSSSGSCVGTCAPSPFHFNFREHAVTLEDSLHGETWRLDYRDGSEREYEQGEETHLWRGAITGPVAGRLLATHAPDGCRLEVELGVDRHLVQVVAATFP